MPKPPPDVEAMMLGKLREYAARNRRFQFLHSDLLEIAAECFSVVPKPRPTEQVQVRSSRSMAVKAPARPSAARNPRPGDSDPPAPRSAPLWGLARLRADATACAALRLVADGATNRDIANQLNLTISQAKHLVSSWSRHTGQAGRAALGTWARRSGVVDDAEATR